MTIPSIKFQCPICKKITLQICDTPTYCIDCKGKGQTKKDWDLSSPSRAKYRTKKYTTNVRMTKLK